MKYSGFLGENFIDMTMKEGILNRLCMGNGACLVNLKFRCLGEYRDFLCTFLGWFIIFLINY